VHDGVALVHGLDRLQAVALLVGGICVQLATPHESDFGSLG
jgi:hypothetical protein